MDRITYQDLVARYGDAMAFDLLLTMEKLAKIEDRLNLADEDVRFERAFEALNQIDFAAG